MARARLDDPRRARLDRRLPRPQGHRGAAPLGRVAAVRRDRPVARRAVRATTTGRSRPRSARAFREGIERRAAGEPLQYVTGEMPFRHLVLRVRPGVFIPRPETEVLVDVALAALPAGPRGRVAIDLCTGSGAVAVSLAHENPWRDRVRQRPQPARRRDHVGQRGARGRGRTRERLRGRPVRARCPRSCAGAWRSSRRTRPTSPRPTSPTLPAEVLGFEPRLALDGGADGLETARRIVAEAPAWLARRRRARDGARRDARGRDGGRDGGRGLARRARHARPHGARPRRERSGGRSDVARADFGRPSCAESQSPARLLP